MDTAIDVGPEVESSSDDKYRNDNGRAAETGCLVSISGDRKERQCNKCIENRRFRNRGDVLNRCSAVTRVKDACHRDVVYLLD